MQIAKFAVEVKLATRNDPADLRSGLVSKAVLVPTSNVKFLTLLYIKYVGGVTASTSHMADLNLDNYFIREIRWRPHKGIAQEMVGFSTRPEDQNEAFELIQELMKYESDTEDPTESEEKMPEHKEDPQRVVLVLNMTKSPGVRREVLALGVTPPNTHFKEYTLSGRILNAYGAEDGSSTAQLPSNVWSIVQYKQYPGDHKQCSTTYFTSPGGIIGVDRQRQGWERLLRFLSQRTANSLIKLRDWEPEEEDDGESCLGDLGGHYTTRVPQHYQNNTSTLPDPAVFRVSGDSEGTKLHLATCEVEVKRPEGERCLPLEEYLEKKAEAEAAVEEASEISAVIDTPPASDSNVPCNSDSGSPPCCDCGSPACLVCNDEYGMAAAFLGAGPWIH